MDTLELHVWGPAFGLPSVDAECLAAIAYLHTALPSSEWRLVPSNDPAIDSSNRLPALNANGVWVTGYAAIVSHLRNLSPHSPSWDLDLDSRLTPSERADALALGAYVESHIAPLLDAYLYADHDNWSAVTRPALSQILGFPLSWTVPVMLHNQAVARSAHLGFGGLGDDHDDDDDDDIKAGSSSQGTTLDRAMKHLPVSGKKSVMEEMRAKTARGIRLHAVTVDALAPLEEQRARGDTETDKKRRFFEGEVPTSLDCLVLGHLVLAQAVEAPQNWLQAILSKRFPHLHDMVDSLRKECLTSPGALPWAPAPASRLRTAARFLDNVVQFTPNLGDAYVNEWRRRAEKKAEGVADRRTLALAGGVLAAGTAIAYGIWTYRGLQPWGTRTQTWVAEKRGLSKFGELGAMLDFSFGLADPVPSSQVSPAAGWGGSLDTGASEHKVVESELSVD
ncbi:mitochondrial import receptor subunit [Colletotrichum truncatum]|uniref:Mitochondrial import receptor subunit n=1 Tax=Colletotrichum truncatum TaxID=5467 RepID=A0ACC3YU60_COLTU|nr:mitochondrial import receptor subunit [Colletotrichum truncatum]KAF6798605.1 mitochondrial import receptor subunit [Colletotrichum truncatum]